MNYLTWCLFFDVTSCLRRILEPGVDQNTISANHQYPIPIPGRACPGTNRPVPILPGIDGPQLLGARGGRRQTETGELPADETQTVAGLFDNPVIRIAQLRGQFRIIVGVGLAAQTVCGQRDDQRGVG